MVMVKDWYDVIVFFLMISGSKYYRPYVRKDRKALQIVLPLIPPERSVGKTGSVIYLTWI